eukprot:834841-Amorphochlora_amoeboformis.AAC.1
MACEAVAVHRQHDLLGTVARVSFVSNIYPVEPKDYRAVKSPQDFSTFVKIRDVLRATVCHGSKFWVQR